MCQDKSGIPWWLGISYKGIAVYDHSDRKTPRRVRSLVGFTLTDGKETLHKFLE